MTTFYKKQKKQKQNNRKPKVGSQNQLFCIYNYNVYKTYLKIQLVLLLRQNKNKNQDILLKVFLSQDIVYQHACPCICHSLSLAGPGIAAELDDLL